MMITLVNRRVLNHGNLTDLDFALFAIPSYPVLIHHLLVVICEDARGLFQDFLVMARLKAPLNIAYGSLLQMLFYDADMSVWANAPDMSLQRTDMVGRVLRYVAYTQ